MILGWIAPLVYSIVVNTMLAVGVSYLASLLMRKPKQTTPELGNYPSQSAMKGIPIQKVYGTRRVAGNILWKKDLGQVDIGGGIKVKKASYLIGICEGPAVVLRYWMGPTLQAGGRKVYFFDGDGTTGWWMKGGYKIDSGYTVRDLTGEQFGDYENTTCCCFVSDQLCNMDGSPPEFTFEVRSGYAGYPQLRPATAQTDPGLAHTTPISTFQDLVDNLLPTISEIVSFAKVGAPIVVTTATPHGFLTGDTVRIVNTTNYNGDKMGITVIDAISFRFAMGGFPGDDACGLVYNLAAAQTISGNFYLISNIDASTTATGDFLDGTGWPCITSFLGTLDGCGYTISNLTQAVSGRSSNYNTGGLFYNVNGTVANLTVSNADIAARSNAGIITNNIGGTGKFYNCHTSGIVKKTGSSAFISNDFGGFAAYCNQTGVCFDCTSSATVDVVNYHSETGVISDVGGFIGFAWTNAQFWNCQATGEVIGAGGTAQTQYVGGFVGYVISAIVTDCSATGNVTGTQQVGGFVGGSYNFFSVFRDCSATGDVTGTHATLGNAGGFLGAETYAWACGLYEDCYAWGDVVGGANSNVGGFSGKGGRLTQCYSIGTVVGGTTGGLVGATQTGASVSDSYWDTEASGQPSSALGTGQTTIWLKTESNYPATWDFDTVWFMGSGFETDCNPAYIVRDLLMHSRYGAGLSPTYIDDTSFATVAGYCADNNILISIVLKETQPIVDAIDYVLAHCNGYRFWSEGKLKLGVFQDQEAVGSTLTQDDLIVDSDEPPVNVTPRRYSETCNRIELGWTDRANKYEFSQITVMDEVDQRVSGEVRTKKLQLDGICRSDLAQTIAYRTLFESLYRRKMFSFSLGYKHMLTEVGDVRALADGYLPDDTKLRILTIKEQMNGRVLACEACDEFAGLYLPITTAVQNAWTPQAIYPTEEVEMTDAAAIAVTPVGGSLSDNTNVNDYTHSEVV